ncbi:MAG: OmpP1/FadL family transporter [Bacteroidales bacterium]
MKKSFIISMLFTLSWSMINAQTAEDALRFSRVFYSGTARFNGLSGAFGAVGADFSTLATNPAGIGLYSGSEMTLTLAPTIANASATYNGTVGTDSRVNFGLGNFGFIFSIRPHGKNQNGILKSFNVGFGFNRQNDFNNRTVITGVNAKNSLMQSYTNTLNSEQIPPATVQDTYPFDLGLAYGTNLIYYNSDKQYECDAAFGGVLQNKIIQTYGSMNELDFSMGANFNDKLFVGLTLGVPSINYYETNTYTEARTSDTLPNFIALNYQYNLQTRGTGINVKFGLIYRPTDWVRIGASVHTPTWFPGMRDEWFSSMQSSFDSTYWNSTQYSPVGYYDYQLTTPFRAIGSLAFIIGQYGLVSADYEYVNYSQARFTSSQDSYTDVNGKIQSDYKSWGNIRVGTEWRLQNFRLRGGFAYFSNPYTGGTNNSERFQVSGGFGYRAKRFFADVTYVWTRMNQDYYLYDPAMVNPAAITYNTNTVYTTIGIRF